MLVQFAEFLFGQRTRVVDDRAINGDLSDVVQVTGYADVLEILTRDTHFPCNRFSVSRYSIRVAARVGIFQVDCRAKRSNRIAIDLPHLAKQTAVFLGLSLKRNEQAMIEESDGDAPGYRADDFDVFFGVLFACELFGK